jgi:RNA polymerase sigma-70 factor (ECF subfamily)
MAAPTDEDLAASAARGDLQAMELLIRRFLKPFHAVCRRIIRDPALADDASQESFLTAFWKLDTYRPDQRFSS